MTAFFLAAVERILLGLCSLFTQHVGDRFPGIIGLSLTIPVAALPTLPVGLPQVIGGEFA